MGVVLVALARWRYTATSHGSWAESERLTRDMRLAGYFVSPGRVSASLRSSLRFVLFPFWCA